LRSTRPLEAERIGRGEVAPDDDAEAVASALPDRSLDRDGFDGEAPEVI
jgi:hypothetical protein